MALRAKKEEIAAITSLSPVHLDAQRVKAATEHADVALALVAHLSQVYNLAKAVPESQRVSRTGAYKM